MMRNNKLYKILRITFLTLAIISMIFTLFYKVGHCSSSGDSGTGGADVTDQTSIPIKVGVGFGYNPNDFSLDSSVVVPLLDAEVNRHLVNYQASSQYFLIESNVNAHTIMFQSPLYRRGYDVSFEYVNDNTYHNQIHYLCDWFIYVTYNVETGAVSGYREVNNSMWINPNYFTDVFHKNTAGYPIFITDYIDNNNVVVYGAVSGGGGGHSKGGSIADISNSIDQIEDSSQLPQVDDDLPTDPTTPNLIKKILSALKTINKTFGGVGVSIVSFLKNIFDSLSEFFVNFWSNLQDLWSTLQDRLFNWWSNWWNNNKPQIFIDYENARNTSSSDVVTAFNNTEFGQQVSNLQNDFSRFKNLFDVTPVSTAPSWSIPLTGTLLYSSSYDAIVIDFSFYEQFKNYVIVFITGFISFSCLYNIIRSLPDIIGGASGDQS